MTYFVSVLREICLKGCAFDGKEDYSFPLSAGGEKMVACCCDINVTLDTGVDFDALCIQIYFVNHLRLSMHRKETCKIK